MPQYMLLLYTPEAELDDRVKRDAELPLYFELNDSLREAGLLVANGRLQGTDSATTVRVRGGEAEITDGPFEVTKEFLAGYYLLECRDLDEALKQAERLPIARYGSIEVRPVMEIPAAAAAQAGEAAP